MLERSHEQIQRRLFDPIGKARDEQRLPSIVNRKSVLTFVMCGNAGLASVCAVYSLGGGKDMFCGYKEDKPLYE